MWKVPQAYSPSKRSCIKCKTLTGQGNEWVTQ